MDELLTDFIAETDRRLTEASAALMRLRADPRDGAALALVRRHVHGIKGIAGCLGLPRVERMTHLAEDALAGAEPSADGIAQAADALYGIARIAAGLLADLRRGQAAPADAAEMARVADAWGALPLLARRLADRLGKRIALTLEGGETAIPHAALPPLREALAQMLRNAIDHGIEPPAERRAAGKPETGALRVSARAEPGAARVEVADDGRGLPLSRIRAQAAALGLAHPAALAAMDDAEAAQLVFRPGLSTAERPTLVSGRGVGLDAAASGLAELGGTAEAITDPGRGCIFVLTLPVSQPCAAATARVLDGMFAG